MEMKDQTVAELSALTASNAPAPGGGSISALAGAFGAALSCMVANLTLGRKNFDGVQDAMRKIIEDAQALREELLLDIERDSRSFDGFMAAMALPKNTDAEKEIRANRMQDALKAAVDVPMSVAEKAHRILPIAKFVVASGNKNAVTDGLVGCMMARTAVRGALFNVKVNLESIRDATYVENMRARVKQLDDSAEAAEAEILALAPNLRS